MTQRKTLARGPAGVVVPEEARPPRTERLPYGRHTVEDEDIDAVVQVLRSRWLTTGPRVEEFEEVFAASVGARCAVSFSSGTAALHGAAFAAGLQPGDEAITSPLTFCATANCVLYQGATPVLADVCSDTLNLDPEQVARRITSRTKAVLPVDYAGHPADYDAIKALAQRHGLLIIEDGCHALGATYKGRPVGQLSDLTVFSFHPVKHITSGEGGMVTTHDPQLARRLRLFRNHGIDRDAHERDAEDSWRYQMVALGFNYRLSDIHCALGLSQLRRLEANLTRRRAIAQRYTEALRGCMGVTTPTVRPEVTPAWHLYPIRVDAEALGASREDIFQALRERHLGVNVHFIPVHRHPYYVERFGDQQGRFPVAEAAYEQLISLPLFHGMSEGDVQDVIQIVGEVLAECGRAGGRR